jgi:hypothetical protein
VSAPSSLSNTKRAVLNTTLQHPVTLFSSGVGILGALAVGLFGATGIPVAAAVGGLSVGMGSWMINYFGRHHTFADRHVRAVYRTLEERRKALLEKVSQTLDELSGSGVGEEYAQQGRIQFDLVDARFRGFYEALAERLQPEEITFSRYLSAAEQLVLAVLDNLALIASLIKSVRTMRPDYIEERLQVLREMQTPNEADQEELRALESRRLLFEQQLARVNRLLTRNEEAITQLDHTIAAILEMRTVAGHSRVDLETAVQELEALATRVSDYSKQE